MVVKGSPKILLVGEGSIEIDEFEYALYLEFQEIKVEKISPRYINHYKMANKFIIIVWFINDHYHLNLKAIQNFILKEGSFFLFAIYSLSKNSNYYFFETRDFNCKKLSCTKENFLFVIKEILQQKIFVDEETVRLLLKN